MHDITSCASDVQVYAVLDLSGGGMFNPPLVPLDPKFSLTPTGLVKNTSKIHC